MFLGDAKLAQLEYEQRLREAAEFRLAQQMQVKQAAKPNYLLDRLGDLLILAGTGLKGWDGSPYATGR